MGIVETGEEITHLRGKIEKASCIPVIRQGLEATVANNANEMPVLMEVTLQ